MDICRSSYFRSATCAKHGSILLCFGSTSICSYNMGYNSFSRWSMLPVEMEFPLSKWDVDCTFSFFDIRTSVVCVQMCFCMFLVYSAFFDKMGDKKARVLIFLRSHHAFSVVTSHLPGEIGIQAVRIVKLSALYTVGSQKVKVVANISDNIIYDIYIYIHIYLIYGQYLIKKYAPYMPHPTIYSMINIFVLVHSDSSAICRSRTVVIWCLFWCISPLQQTNRKKEFSRHRDKEAKNLHHRINQYEFLQ